MVTVYTTKTCGYCPMVKKYLTLKNVEYQEVDVTEDATIREKLLSLTGMTTVPVTTNGDEFVVGFKPQLLAKFAL
jgi:glutaredoxin-like YruB-family protein